MMVSTSPYRRRANGVKTLREVMGLRDSYGDIKLGDMVRIKTSGHVGKVEAIGRHGLLAIQGIWGVYGPWEVEIVDKKITA